MKSVKRLKTECVFINSDGDVWVWEMNLLWRVSSAQWGCKLSLKMSVLKWKMSEVKTLEALFYLNKKGLRWSKTRFVVWYESNLSALLNTIGITDTIIHCCLFIKLLINSCRTVRNPVRTWLVFTCDGSLFLLLFLLLAAESLTKSQISEMR